MQKNLQTIPNDACQLRAATGGASVVEDTFTLTPYKMGQRVKHPFWDEFMFEASSMKMGRTKIPVTVDHKTERGAGYATSMYVGVDGLVKFDGNFVQNEHAEYVKSFKGTEVMETSLQFDPNSTDFLYLDEGESSLVDGEEVSGPIVIFRNAEIIEVAFTLMGAVPNTQTSFSKPLIFKESPMADQVPNEAEVLASAKSQMQTQFSLMNDMCGDKEFVASCFSKGMSIEDFSGEVIKKLNEENAQFTARISELESEVETLKTASAEGQESVSFSAGGDGEAEDKPLDCEGLVSKFCSEGMKRSQAFLKVAREYPEEYAQFRKSL